MSKISVLADEPDRKVEQVGYEEARQFLKQYDRGRLSDLVEMVEVHNFEPVEIVYTKTMQRGAAEYNLVLEPEDAAAEQMLEQGMVDNVLSGQVSSDRFLEVEA